MRYFDGEIKHLDRFKFNNGRCASEFNPRDIYDPAAMCSNFYDDAKTIDKRNRDSRLDRIRRFLDMPYEED